VALALVAAAPAVRWRGMSETVAPVLRADLGLLTARSRASY
jgi:hypothetical protein